MTRSTTLARHLHLIVFVVLSVALTLSTAIAATTGDDLTGIRIPFIKNAGQVDSQVEFYAQTFGGTVFLTDENSIVYALTDGDGGKLGVSLKENFIHGTYHAPRGEVPSPTRISDFRGRNAKAWSSNTPAFEYVCLGEVYPRIDVRLRAHGDNVEKLFFVQPSGDPQDIQVELEGATSLAVNGRGELVAETELGPCAFTRPIAYQHIDGRTVPVDVEYALAETGYGFALGEYDPAALLVIDPLLASTFVGGSAADEDYEPCIAIDGNGSVFFTGRTSSPNFPTTSGVFDSSMSGGTDRVIAKYSSDLSTLLASTFIGGYGHESGMGICFDSDDNVYIAGYTSSPNFPITPGAFDSTFNGGGEDAFVARLSNDLSTLQASTFFGGNGLDGGGSPRIDMAIGIDGTVYIAGLTNSANLPTQSSSYSRTYGGAQDFFVARFDADLTTLMSSTYLGGYTDEWRPSIQIDSEGAVFVSGTTRPGFPTTPGAYAVNFHGGTYDMVIAKLSSDLSTLLASTYLGSNGEDNLKGIRLDEEGNIYTAGYTTSPLYPSTAGAFDTSYNGGEGDFCCTKLDNDLATILASTFIGGTGFDNCEDVALDADGNVHLVGFTNSTNFPTTSDAHSQTYSGTASGAELGVVILDGDLTSLQYSTYFGSGLEKGKCIVVDDSGSTYVSGITYSTSYPTTPGCHDDTLGGSSDGFIARFGEALVGVDLPGEIPARHHLNGNYPNPFNPATTISFSLTGDSEVALSIFDLRGKLVCELLNGHHPAGDHRIRWNGCDGTGAAVASGVYTCRLTAGDVTEVKPMNLIR